MDLILPHQLLYPNNSSRNNLFCSNSSTTKLRCLSDKDYGGDSSCQYTIDLATNESVDKIRSDCTHVLKFEGMLRFGPELQEKTKAKTGFCALKMDFSEEIDLRDYEGLEMIIRSKQPQEFTFNMRCASYDDDDLFQLNIQLPGKSNWSRIVAPFDKFQLMNRGREKEDRRRNDSLQLESLAYLVRQCDFGWHYNNFFVLTL